MWPVILLLALILAVLLFGAPTVRGTIGSMVRLLLIIVVGTIAILTLPGAWDAIQHNAVVILIGLAVLCGGGGMWWRRASSRSSEITRLCDELDVLQKAGAEQGARSQEIRQRLREVGWL